MTQVVIIGAGGLGREVLDTLLDDSFKKKYSVYGFVDDDIKLVGQKINGVRVLGTVKWIKKNTKYRYVFGISNPHIRKKIITELKGLKINFLTLIHPTSIISKFAKIGKGSIIQAGCIITANSKIKNYVVVNVNCVVGHDSIVNNFVTLSPFSDINGKCTVGELSDIGSGTITRQGINIGKKCIIGAGSVIVKDLPNNVKVFGVPAKIR